MPGLTGYDSYAATQSVQGEYPDIKFWLHPPSPVKCRMGTAPIHCQKRHTICQISHKLVPYPEEALTRSSAS